MQPTVSLSTNTTTLVESAESNDTIATAIATGLSTENNVVSVDGSISFDFRNNRDVDQTEDVDMYSVELQAGDTITLDIDSVPYVDANGVTLRGGADLSIFNAAGERLEYSSADAAPGELLEAGRDAYLEFTAEEAGTYYIGVSQHFNDNFDPNVKGTGDGGKLNSPTFGLGSGPYNLEIKLNPEAPVFEQFVEYDGPAPTNVPVVSLNAIPGTFQGNEIIFPEIVEAEGVGRGRAAILNLSFTVDGMVPPEGLEVIVKLDTDFRELLDDVTSTPRAAGGAELLGAVYNADGTPAGIRVMLTGNNATIPLTVGERTDDPETPQTVNLSLANSSDYLANSSVNGGEVVFYDTLEQLQDGGDVPTIGIAADQTTLIESEGTEVNLTFNVQGTIPEDGVLVYVSSGVSGALGEFDVFNAEVTGADFPAPDGNAGGFFIRVREDGANVKVKVFDETTNPQIPAEDALEGVQELSFSVIGGAGYIPDENASTIDFVIKDNPDSLPLEDNGGGTGGNGGPTDNDGRTSNNDTIVDAVDLGLTATNPTVTVDGEIAQRFRGAGNTADASEDVDMYAFTLEAGQTVNFDIDAKEAGYDDSLLDAVLRVFDADGNELQKVSNASVTDGVVTSTGDPVLKFTAPASGTYYLGVSHLGNDFYDPNVANSGSGWTFDGIFEPGAYQLNVTSDIPTQVSIDVTPEVVSEADANPVVNINFTIEGDIPAPVFDAEGNYVSGGLSILYTGTIAEFFEQVTGGPNTTTLLPGPYFDAENNISELILLDNNATVGLTILDDVIQEADQEFTFTLVENDGSIASSYSLNPEASTDTVTLTDGVEYGDTTVGISVSETELTEGDQLTVNFDVNGDIPAEGLEVLVQSPTTGALGEFAIFDENGNFAIESEGIAGDPIPYDGQGNSFLVTLTEPNASMTLGVFNDGPGEGTESLTFGLVEGERYNVDATNNQVVLTIEEAAAEVKFEADANGEVSKFAYDLTNAGNAEITATVDQEALDITDAAFDNLVGFYEVVDQNGGVLDSNGNVVNPGDAGYAQAALENAVDGIALRLGGNPNDDTTAGSFGDSVLQGGTFYAPFAIANAGDMTVAEFLAANPNNDAATEVDDQVAYFAFGEANPDGANHLKSWGDGVFGFEDLPSNLGVSDNDFNDAVFKFNFTA